MGSATPHLIDLVFLAVMFIAFRKRNEKMADIAVAIFLISALVLGSVNVFKWDLETAQRIYAFFARPWFYMYLFLLSGILAKIYFSRYYGVIISKVGIILVMINALIIGPLTQAYAIYAYSSPYREAPIFDYFGFFLSITFEILFFVMYFKLLSNINTNLKITPKNDPKNW